MYMNVYIYISDSMIIYFEFSIYTSSWQAMLKQAAKQRLRRYMTEKKKRKELEAPEWVRREWKTRSKDEMAQLLMDCNWSKVPLRGFLTVVHWFCSYNM